jgi:hypothetical protein
MIYVAYAGLALAALLSIQLVVSVATWKATVAFRARSK